MSIEVIESTNRGEIESADHGLLEDRTRCKV